MSIPNFTLLPTRITGYAKMIIVESKLARHITEVREGRGWSQRELGRRAGISGAAISKLESGATEPTNDTIVKVARALGESPEDLLRLAGHLPDAPPPTDLDSTVGDIFRSLPDTQRNAINHMRLPQGGSKSRPSKCRLLSCALWGIVWQSFLV